ncbi:LacI family DNA-binding transcriptional regulator [Paenibacillus sp. CGMCC 1.18879]|uniref:LacI family DNA-binding transcriptional regulator n=1 Tax=Paenibacillus sp. CGMCC 1.18879 TaxID=2834466 RepID=UPI001CA836DE|nr:LacI family DNA-binding transcriptional regulator [Paenibacillus sp. CGMCC 1.18879]MBY9078327.1 LacI family DNA-binding transcriptional regulator [Paenibacillus sp. CGMCC 1.18879]
MKTIADIANLAGVAKSTVSRYLNGGSISESTKMKIERVVNNTGYVPNTFAQSLKAKKTNIIGTIVPRLDSFASSQILIGIDEQLRNLNYQMLIANTAQNLDREIESLYNLYNQKVAGIILLATQITDIHLEAFETIKIPVILVGQQHDNVYSVVHDNELAGFEIGEYILKKGHRKVAYLGVSEADIAVGVKRKEGFRRALNEKDGCEVRYYETQFAISEAVIRAGEIIDSFHPSILACATDNIALGALKAAHVRGLNIPTDLSITGFGGYEVTEIIHPALTTIKFNYTNAGRDAANGIIKLVNGEMFPMITSSEHELIERESVDSKTIER